MTALLLSSLLYSCLLWSSLVFFGLVFSSVVFSCLLWSCLVYFCLVLSYLMSCLVLTLTLTHNRTLTSTITKNLTLTRRTPRLRRRWPCDSSFPSPFALFCFGLAIAYLVISFASVLALACSQLCVGIRAVRRPSTLNVTINLKHDLERAVPLGSTTAQPLTAPLAGHSRVRDLWD